MNHNDHNIEKSIALLRKAKDFTSQEELVTIYSTIRQRGRVVYEQIVDEGETRVDYIICKQYMAF